MDETRRFERQIRRDVLIVLLALVSVAIGVYEVLHPRLAPGFTMLDAVDLGIVFVFIVDFVTQARRSGDWRGYVRRHWYEVPSLIPVTGGLIEGLHGASLVRGLRLVRVARIVRLARVVGVAARFKHVRRYTGRVVRRAQLFELAVGGFLAIFIGAVAVFVFEGPANPRMDSLETALWWSINIFTTTTYLDFHLVTRAGHVVASVLMVIGVGFIGVFTASLASAILKEPADSDEDEVGLE